MEANKELDLGNLTLFDYNAVTAGDNDTQTIENITSQLVENLQFILNSLVQEKRKEVSAIQVLPEQQQIIDFEKSKLYLQLPEPKTVFPRSRKLPEAKKQTKWEKFSKEKGIKKRKRTGMQYDPSLKTQVSRWGKKSKKNLVQPAIMQQKQLGRNPFQDTKTEKKLRVVKNHLKQQKNVERNKK